MALYDGSNMLYGDSPVGSVASDQWTHVCGVWPGGNDLVFYINGSQETDVTYGGGRPSVSSIQNTNEGLAIGAIYNFGSPGGWFNGQIDDVRIYNYALTPLQIKTLYNNGSVSFGD